MEQNTFMGRVVFSNKEGFAIIEDGYGAVYISSPKVYYLGQEVIFDRRELIKMPSLLYAMVELGEITRKEIKNFIKEKGEE